MSDSTIGPGVKSFWASVERGDQPNIVDLSCRFPNETLALVDAMRELSRQRSTWTRERMWAARNKALLAKGEAVSLGAFLKEKRISVGLSAQDVASQLSSAGVRVASDAIRKLEDNALSPVAVRPPSMWEKLAGVLSIDAAELMSFLTLAVQGQKTVQQFSRMNRGSASEDRERFLNEASVLENEQSAKYLRDVRRELGLPALRRDLPQ